MAEEAEIAKTAAKGAVQLFTARAISRSIAFIGTLVLIRLLGPENYGLIAVVMVFPNILLLLDDPYSGISSATTKYLAEYRVNKQLGKIKPIIFSAFTFRLFLGIGLTAFCFVAAGMFASILGKPELAPLIRVASLTILAWALFYFAVSVFMGLDVMINYAILMIIYDAFKAVLPVGLVLIGMGVLGAVIGNVIGFIFAGSVGVVLVIVVMRKIAKRGRSMTSRGALKQQLSYGSPLMLASLIGAGAGRYYSFLMAAFCALKDIGDYKAAFTMTLPIYYITLPIMEVLFPALSKLGFENNPQAMERVFRYSVKYSSLIILPLAALTSLFAKPIIQSFFGAKYEGAWLYLLLLAATWLNHGFGGGHLSQLLMSQGQTKVITKINIITTTAGVIAASILIPYYGILGLILTSVVGYLFGYVFVIREVHRLYGIETPLNYVWKIYASVFIVMALLWPLYFVNIGSIFVLALGVVAGLIVYILCLSITRALDANDMRNIKVIAKPYPIVSKIIGKVLDFIAWLSR